MNFYIGQKVKKVRGRDNAGVTGTVVQTDYGDENNLTLAVRVDFSCVVNPGQLFREKIISAGQVAWGFHEDFEPILPPGLESPAEIAALYEPEDAIA